MSVKDPTLSIYEWILGMRYRTLCKNSRLFLMPLLSTIHSCYDEDICFFLPVPPVLDHLWFFLVKVLEARERGGEPEDLWAQLRAGERSLAIPGLREGLIHPYMLVCHPFITLDTRVLLDYPGTFYSHVSPLGCLLSGYRMLSKWESETSHTRSHTQLPDPPPDRRELLTLALRRVGRDEEFIRHTVETVAKIYEKITSILQLFERKADEWAMHGGSDNDNNDSSGRGSRHRAAGQTQATRKRFESIGFGLKIQQMGLQDNFQPKGCKKLNEWSSTPHEGMSFFLHNISIGSTPSVISQDGQESSELAEVQGKFASVGDSGPTLCQEIARAWRLAQQDSGAIMAPLEAHVSHRWYVLPSLFTVHRGSFQTVLKHTLPSRIILNFARTIPSISHHDRHRSSPATPLNIKHLAFSPPAVK
ncbi:hypothetical protein GGU11DRAFT_743905 [Lentinula aff. detonsa]|nr:hypothetical protein GGU11DRAFT_743905 [Lentinula aff. detonsa]